MAGNYDIGDRWTPQATFTVAGNPTDPTTLVVRSQNPAGVEAEILNSGAPASLTPSSTPVARVSAGVYKLNPGIALTASGYWFVRFAGTGAAETAETHQAIVDPDPFYRPAGALTTVERVRRSLRQPNVDNWEILDAINSYSQAIHKFTGREFVPMTPALDSDPVVTRNFLYEGNGWLSLEPYELRPLNLGTVVLTYSDGGTLTVNAADYELRPIGLTGEGTYTDLLLDPWESDGTIAISGRWGAGVVPDDIELACRISVSNYFRNPEGFSGRSVGEATFTEFSPVTEQARRFPQDAYELLLEYQRAPLMA